MRKIVLFLFWISLLLSAIYCNQSGNETYHTNEFLNLNDTVSYVGMETCRSCHANVYDTYIHTGMGQSFDIATKEKSAAKFDEHAIVYDKDTDFYYKPFWKDSSLFIKEFRLENKDTIHSRTEKISYVIGSGQHTNSHLIDQNGYVFQAPITFYTQDGKWDLAPGFEGGANSRFSRIIATECMTCHNHLPKQLEGAVNKYEKVPTGIECERCHGPGEIHVKEKLAGNIIDTSKYIDYSIVNPAHLPVDLEMDICQRCHLQGTAVLKKDKTFYDFRPGMKLSEVMNVFLPRYTNAHEKFIMASQADRMRLSDCYKIGEMSCTSCHNPHKSVQATSINQFNQVCAGCHQNDTQKKCTEQATALSAAENNCVQCHMPKSGSIDIPHVRITDHYVTKPVKEPQKSAIAEFVGLACLTKDNPEPLEMAEGYLALFDKFVPDLKMLDSASFYLNRSKQSTQDKLDATVHLAFNKGDLEKIINQSKEVPIEKINQAWTLYRIGEAFSKTGQHQAAEIYFEKAVKLQKYNLDFNTKLGATLMHLKKNAEAKAVFKFILAENEKEPVAQSNIGYIYLLEGDLKKSGEAYDKAIALDPDYEQALFNKVGWHLVQKQEAPAINLLNRILKKNPSNEKAKQILTQLKNQ